MISVMGKSMIGSKNDCFRLLLSLEKRFAPFFRKRAVSRAASAFCLNVLLLYLFIVISFLAKMINFSLRLCGDFIFWWDLL